MVETTASCGSVAERPYGARVPGRGSAEVTQDGTSGQGVGADLRGPEGGWRRPLALGANAASSGEGAGRLGPRRWRLLSASDGRSIPSFPCDLAPCPSQGRLRGLAARSRPCFVWTWGRRGSAFPARAPPPSSQSACVGVATVPDWLRGFGCGVAPARRLYGLSAALSPHPTLRASEPVRKMPAAVTGCGGSAPPGSPPLPSPTPPSPPLRSSRG